MSAGKDMPTANAFAHQVEELVWDRDVTYIEAVLEWCKARGVDPETAAGLVKKSAPLKAKIEEEAEKLRIIPSSGARLPI